MARRGVWPVIVYGLAGGVWKVITFITFRAVGAGCLAGVDIFRRCASVAREQEPAA